MFKQVEKYQDVAPVIIRVLVGIVFLLHGLAKLGVIGGGSLQGTIGMFGNLGMPLPAVTGTLVALVETFGGLALILGVATRISAVLLAVIMLVAMLTVKLPMQPNPIAAAGPMPGYELDLALLAGLTALFFLGAGKAALDNSITRNLA